MHVQLAAVNNNKQKKNHEQTKKHEQTLKSYILFSPDNLIELPKITYP